MSQISDLQKPIYMKTCSNLNTHQAKGEAMVETKPPPTKKMKRNHSQSRSRKRRKTSNRGVYIPDDVLEVIFTFLPIKDAIKVGSLSKRFRNLWLWNQNLDFDHNLVASKDGSQDRFIETLDGILKRHLQPEIRRMKLFFNPRNPNQHSKLDEWVEFASGKGARELDFDFGYEYVRETVLTPGHKFMKCSSLKVLKLRHCTISSANDFEGLKSLRTLVLRHVDVTMEFVSVIKSTCVLLETLDLIQCRPSLSSARITALHLRWFPKGVGCPERFLVQLDIPNPPYYQRGKKCERSLTKMSLSAKQGFDLSNVISKLTTKANGVTQQSRLRNLLREFPNADVLTINKAFVQSIKGPQHCLSNLKELHLLMEDDSSYCNPYYVVLLLRSCPSLERVFINLEGSSFYPASSWSLRDKENILRLNDWFKRLKYVKLSSFKPGNAEMELVKFFLEKAVVLETLALILPKKRDGRHPEVCVEDVNGHANLFYLSWRKSSNAQVYVSDYSKDDSCLEPAHHLIQSHQSFYNHVDKCLC